MTTVATERHWRARPVLARILRYTLLAVPLVASLTAVVAVSRLLPPGDARTWWGLALLLATALLVAALVERGARRLLPIALLLKLSMIFPDRAPSRLRLARAAATSRRPRDELLWTGGGARPTSTSQLVLDLVTALGTHDRRTRGHSERVRLLCDMLALELKLDEDDRDRLRWASLLHDVGKITVSTRILNKPERLSAREFTSVKKHPAAGAVLAAPLLPWLGAWGDGIQDHHERYDGSGYPHGKAGDEISVAGRLIGLIDAFETMTATRPYKKAVATRAAREELARCAGTHFDPVYVRAFLAISLPRLLWAMGPLSFLLSLPFLQSLAQTGARASVAAPQAAGTLAAGAAGAAVLATGGTAGGTAGGAAAQPPDRSSAALAQPAPEPGSAGPAGPVSAPPVQSGPSVQSAPAVAPAPPGSPAAADRESPPAARPAPARRAADGGPTAGPAAPPAPAAASPAPAPAAASPAAEQPAADQPHRAIVSGPPPRTSSREATFQLADEPGVAWECQLKGNAAGESSRWQPCSGRFTVTVGRAGDHVLRVRDAATRDETDSWSWTVTE